MRPFETRGGSSGGNSPESGRVHVITEKGERVADSRIVPASEWTGFTTALRTNDVVDATGFLSRWGIDSMATVSRSETTLGHPLGLKALEGYRAPIATDAKFPDGKAGVQITIDKAKPASQEKVLVTL